jgi:TetR/AcrR family transcriptional regulator, transcriptional repressor for nem operon
MSPRGKRQGENTRQAVLEAAIRKFGEKSFLTATTAEIAEEAQVSEKTVFDLFGDKKTLYLEVREHIRRTAIADMLPRLPIGAGAPRILRALGREFLREVSRNSDRARVSLQSITAIDDPEIKKSTQDFFLETHSLVKRVLKNGQQAGLVSEDLDLVQFAWTYAMALHAVGFVTLMDYPQRMSEDSALVFLNRLIDTIEPGA